MVRVDVYEELKFLRKFKKKIGGGGGGVGLCVQVVGDVNEVFVNIHKKKIFFLGGGGVVG